MIKNTAVPTTVPIVSDSTVINGESKENDTENSNVIRTLSTTSNNNSSSNSSNNSNKNASDIIFKKRTFDYYLWIMSSIVTHVEVLLEKVAGAIWGDTSKEQSLLVSTETPMFRTF